MFSRISIKNFRVFNQASVSFKDKRGTVKPTILIFGYNDSGKTSFIKALSFIRETMDLLHFNRLLDTRSKTKYHHRYQKITLKDLVHHNFRANALGNMELAYEIYLNNSYYTYEIIFNSQGELVSEILLKRGKQKQILIFANDTNGFEVGTGMIPTKHHRVLSELYQRYHTQYTLLSIIYYARQQELITFKTTLKDFVFFVSNLYINHDEFHHQVRYNYKHDVNINPLEGTTNSVIKIGLMKASAKIINDLATSLFPTIDSVKYEFTKRIDGSYDYKMKCFIKTTTTPVAVDIEHLPRSFRKVMGLSTAIFDLKQFKYTIILDDMSDKLHGQLLEKFLTEFYQNESQVIMSFVSTDIMNKVDPKAIYITNYKVEGAQMINIEDVTPTRFSQDIRGRYESGLYAQEPALDSPRLNRYARWLGELVKGNKPDL